MASPAGWAASVFTGLLRHSAAVRRRVAVLDGGLPTYTELGQPITTIELVATIRCRVEPLEARELAALHQAGPVLYTHRVFAVRGVNVNEADNLLWGDQVLEVVRIDDLGGAGRYLELHANLVVAHDVPDPAPS